MSKMKPALRVAIAGVGTVGGGIATILGAHRNLLAQRCGRPIELVAVADQRPKSKLVDELAGWDQVEHYSDAVNMVETCQDLDVVVETIGGYGVALKIAKGALGRGISLVTANKAMLAVHASDLVTTAESNKAKIGWEAAVGGGIPCIRSLREGCSANRISYAAGILNGTCNFILTTMKETGRDFDDVLAEAQALGYAETPPDLDIDGIDTAHKLSLVAAVSTGCFPDYEGVHTEGIRAITGDDVELAEALGFSIKLLGISSRVEPFEDEHAFQKEPFRPCVNRETNLGEALPGGPGGEAMAGVVEERPVVLQRVHPALVPKGTALGSTHGVLNGLFTVGDFVGPVFTQGRGAGRDATASACVADIVDIARGGAVATPTFGVQADKLNTMVSASMEQRVGRYYLRVNGSSLHKRLLGALQEANIPVEAVRAKELDTGVYKASTSGSIAVITGVTIEASIKEVMATIVKPNAPLQSIAMIRVEGPW
jgi:homoserine dehydrogenase